ncbi:MAG: hypothetical protein CMJ25_22755 [Phycisphaerae bacterium]|nr:hypothetical protein [Phycisphaerae bacterium]|tara:strand:- start:219 stop:1058 length:840 start_codon:yes stop_codon:yes gene_type:complete
MIKGVKSETIQEVDIVVKEVKNCPLKYDNTERVLIIDADSIMYFASHFPEDSLMEFPTEEERIEEAKYRTRTKLEEIHNNIEEFYNIQETFIFVRGRGNFRYKLYPNYKSNRKQKNDLIPIISFYMLNELHAIPSIGAEADDYVYDAYLLSGGNCVVAAIDKDVFYNCPDVPFYNYRSHGDTLGEFKSISKEESRLAIASQVVIGDSGDGIPGAYRVGKAWCRDNMHLGMTDYQFTKAIFKAYLKASGGNGQIAKEQARLNYSVLKLYTQDELKTINKR